MDKTMLFTPLYKKWDSVLINGAPREIGEN